MLIFGKSLHPEKKNYKLFQYGEIFIYMHRNFRVSRNIRAHWLFDHLNKTVRIEEESAAEVVASFLRLDLSKIDALISINLAFLQITYISRYYRHVFVLDLSPSTIVAVSENYLELLFRLLICFTIPGTRRTFSPQIYVSVCVFIPFLAFESLFQVLVQGILLTESNINSVLHTVTEKFNNLLNSLYFYSKGILQKWGTLRRRHRVSPFTSLQVVISAPPKAPAHPRNIMDYAKGIWPVSATEDESMSRNPLCDGYIHPEWALIFMLRLGLIAVQMMHENTQSNIIVITDAVCGMPDASALQQLLSQLRSYTVSCSFIQLQGRSRSEACFGHVASCELFHFLAMATFGVYIPNCRCSIGPLVCSEDEEEVDENEYKPLNPFHRALLCWCFQNALQDNVHITNLVNEINPEFAQLYKNDVVRHRYIRSIYRSALHEILYIRLREGFTLKQVRLCNSGSRIMIVLSMPFRPLVFIDYTIIANWPSDRMNVTVDLVIQAPYNELKDLLSEGQFPNAVRQKLVKSLRNLIDDILEADRVLLHIHAFNTDPVYYRIPVGVSTKIPIFTLEDKTKMSIFLGGSISLCLYCLEMKSSDVPIYFYMIKVTLEAPCLVLRTAFLGGISSTERRNVSPFLHISAAGAFIHQWMNSVQEALSVIRRPLERIMIRYRSIPKDLLTIVRVCEDEAMEDPKLLILHNAISKYLECRSVTDRYRLILCRYSVQQTIRNYADFQTVLMQRRLQEGFRVAWSHEGIRHIWLCGILFIDNDRLKDACGMLCTVKSVTCPVIWHGRTHGHTDKLFLWMKHIRISRY
ncbi:unnamed protein product [Heligmosomoides polygyrus]|uniref:Protein SZT2 n=1 Tax=Heligmosomoides polygyrus TaxID=6339 RepID=A0A3P7YNM6_HELPZ|nr:unnamed protein product [Heligmosomoides polygyrus]